MLKLLEEREKIKAGLEDSNRADFPVLKKISETEKEIASFRIDSLPENNTEEINKKIFSEKRNIETLCRKISENIVLE